MDVITNGTVSNIEHTLLVAHPGTQVHFHGAIEATVSVLAYGFEAQDTDSPRCAEWTFGDQMARPRAAHRAAEHLVALATAPDLSRLRSAQG